MKYIDVVSAEIVHDDTYGKPWLTVAYTWVGPKKERVILKDHDTMEEALATYRYYFHSASDPDIALSFPRKVRRHWDLSDELLK